MFAQLNTAMFISCYSTVDIGFTCVALFLLTHLSFCELSVPHISNQHQSLAQLSEAILSASTSSIKWTSPHHGLPSSLPSHHRMLIPLMSSSPSLASSLPVTSLLTTSKQSSNRKSRVRLSGGLPLFSDVSKQNSDFDQVSGSRYERYSSRSKVSLRRYMLHNTNVTCNDGTKAGFYYRSSASSRRWIIFLEGGWYCFSSTTCHQRWLQMRNLMSSAHWPQVRNVGGILSPNKDENPYFWNSNHVFVPYCSSDSWSGDSPAKTSADLSFLGSRIIEEVVLELMSKGLKDGKMLLLAGSSAGAGGVLVNLDKISDMLRGLGSKIEVRGIIDSGWFLDNEPFSIKNSAAEDKFSDDQHPILTSTSSSCIDTFNCSPVESIKRGMSLWNGQVPKKCRQAYPSEPWRCYFGYRLYPMLQTPLFVFQWIFDEAQMMADNVGAPVTKAQWAYVKKMGLHLRQTLSNVTAVFAPSCISHAVLTKSMWTSIEINGTSLPTALKCWETRKGETTGSLKSASNSPTRRISHERQLHLFSENFQLDDNKSMIRFQAFPDLEKDLAVQFKKKARRHKKHKKRHQNYLRSKRLANRKCKTHLIDTCFWPQCNSGCPKM